MINLQAPLPGRQATLIGLAIFLLNLGLKLLFVDAQPIANDEPFTLFWAQQPLSAIWELAQNENNPPLFFAVEHVWIKLFGWEVTSLRLPSVLFASLAAMMLFRSGNRHFGLYAGLMAALLSTCATEHVYYAHETRAYPLLCLLTIAAVDQFLCLMGAPRRWQNYLALGLINVLLVYTHFLGVWVLLAQLVLWLLAPARWAVARRLAVMFLGVALAYLPNLYAFAIRLKSVSDRGTWVPQPHWTQLYGHINIYVNGAIATAALLLILGLGVGWMLIGKKSRAASLRELGEHRVLLVSSLLFGLVYLGIYVQSIAFSPAFIPRYLIFASMPFFLAIAGWMHFLIRYPRLQLASLGIVLLAMLPGLKLNPSNQRDIKGVVSYIQQQKSPETAVIICPDYFDLLYAFHADLATFQDYAHLDDRLAAQKVYAVNAWSQAPQNLRDSKRVIYLDADSKFVFPDNTILPQLQGQYKQLEMRHFEEIFDVYLFER